MTAATPFPLLDLPSEVLSNILGTFSNGRTISTFLMVVQGCRQCKNNEHDDQEEEEEEGNGDSLTAIIRNALYHRYGQLLEHLQFHEEIADVLMVLREDVRTSRDGSKFPEWCAILDYFESQMGKDNLEKGWIVWCGSIESAFGEFHAALRCSLELWTLGALHYWCHEVEMNQFAIVHPFSRSLNNEQLDLTKHYGTIEGLLEKDQLVLERQYVDLDEEPQSWQHYLVLRPKTYEELPSEFFTPKIGDNKLFCYWDPSEYHFDWESSLSRLGEDVIRIMTRCIQEKGRFP